MAKNFFLKQNTEYLSGLMKQQSHLQLEENISSDYGILSNYGFPRA